MSKNEVPNYMDVLWNKVYNNVPLYGVLSDDRIVNIVTLWQQNNIMKDVLKDITKEAHVLQIGLTFGNEINMIYEKVNKKGKIDIFDISDTQLRLAKEKYKHHNIEIFNYNALLPWDEKYDVVLCYNLLSELPDESRRVLMNNVLSSLTTGGKAIFVDYGCPQKIFLPRFLIKWFNMLYKPTTMSLWENPIEYFSDKKDEYRWYHKYYMYGVFQKVTAVKKILDNDDVKKYTRIFKSKK